MKKSIKIFAAAILGLAAVSCASPEKMAKMADSVTVSCNPAVLEAVAGKVMAEVTVTYPADYFHPKAILEVTPVLVYEGGEAAMKPFMYQGVKVKDNYKVVSSEGQTVKEIVHFDYAEGMEVSHLELRGVASFKNKSVNLPVKKVADGMNTTYMLVKAEGYLNFKKDNYQEIIKQTEEGQILYSINSSNVANKQLKSQSIKDFQAALDEIKANERKTLVGTEVVAYASPDGGEKLNTKLSDKRSQSADKAWDKVVKGKEVADPTVKSVGQDWEGFQELVSKSNIEDKDLILRVLNMYSDPAVRENEIKNMSEIYTSLKSSVLPELRRARFIANVEYKNYTSEELLELVENNIDVLDEEALLRAASLTKDLDAKTALYKKAADKFNSDRAQYNLAVCYLYADKVEKAAQALKAVKAQDGDVINALGVVALREGKLVEASNLFKKSGTALAASNQGIVNILQGDYAAAAQNLKDHKGCCFNKVLAYILNGELAKAEAAATCKDADAAYLKAIIDARQGDAAGVKANLEKASESKELAARAKKDIEFAQYR